MSDKKIDMSHSIESQIIEYIKAATSEKVREEVQKINREFSRKSVEMRKEIENQNHRDMDNYAESKIDNQ